jgi:cytochrome P450 family 142 subfamily A polypeptide 1
VRTRLDGNAWPQPLAHPCSTVPDALDIQRHPNEHHAFGFGTHFCPGLPLSRLEARLAVTPLLRRLPDLALAGAPVRNGNPVLRGLQSLPVRWTPGSIRYGAR